METELKTITKNNEFGVAINWYVDSEVKINSINGYDILYRRIFYEKGFVKRIVVAFSEKERNLASNSPDLLEALTKLYDFVVDPTVGLKVTGLDILIIKERLDLAKNAITKATN